MTTDRILKRESAASILKEIRRGKKLVFTNGCFDIIHVGHINYLEQAKQLGDILVVGINSDRSVRVIKGDKRPIISEYERARIVSSLRFVDYVVIFDEETPVSIIKEIQPDIHVKGGDYHMEELPEYPIVRSYGGKVVILPYITGKSTTAIINKILLTFGK
jgi:glycerol-3-phosphate cytidylyltransferase